MSTNIFQMGWFNHQPVIVDFLKKMQLMSFSWRVTLLKSSFYKLQLAFRRAGFDNSKIYTCTWQFCVFVTCFFFGWWVKTWPFGNVVKWPPTRRSKGHEVESPGGFFLYLISWAKSVIFQRKVSWKCWKIESLVSYPASRGSLIDCSIILPAGCGDGGNGKTIKTAWQDGPLLHTCSYKLYLIKSCNYSDTIGLINKWVTACGYFTP